MPGSGAFRNKLIVDHQNAGNLADIIGNGKQTVPGGGGVDQATKDQNKILDETRKSASLTAKGMMNQPRWWTKALKTMGVQMGISGILKQSQIFTSTLGSLFQILGAFVDVILAPWIPVIIPALRKLALQVPRIRKWAQEFKDWVVDTAWPWVQIKWELAKKIWDGSYFDDLILTKLKIPLMEIWNNIMGSLDSTFKDSKIFGWIADAAKGSMFDIDKARVKAGLPPSSGGIVEDIPVKKPEKQGFLDGLKTAMGYLAVGGGLAAAGQLAIVALAKGWGPMTPIRAAARLALGVEKWSLGKLGRGAADLIRGKGGQAAATKTAQTAAGPAARTGMMVGARALLTGGLAAGVGTAMFSTAMLASVPLIIWGMKPLANKAIDKLIPKSKFKSELQNISGTMDELKRTTDSFKIVNAMTAQKKKLKALHPNLSDVERLAMMRENLGITGGLGTGQKLSMPAHLLTSRPMMNKQQIEQMGGSWPALPLRQHKWKRNKKDEWEKWGFEDRLHASRWANRGLMTSSNFRVSSTGSRSFDPANGPFTSSGIPNLDPSLGTETYRKQAAKDNIVDPLVVGFQKVMDNVTLSINVSGLGDLPPKNGSVSAEAYTA